MRHGYDLMVGCASRAITDDDDRVLGFIRSHPDWDYVIARDWYENWLGDFQSEVVAEAVIRGWPLVD